MSAPTAPTPTSSDAESSQPHAETTRVQSTEPAAASSARALEAAGSALESMSDATVVSAMVNSQLAEVQNRLLDRIATLDKQVADLQVDQVRAGKPWWQNVSVLIALSALLLSLTTTTVSLMQSRAREQHDARVELRDLIQRLSDLPRAYATLPQVYTNTSVVANLGGIIQEENAVLAKQAREVMQSIPDQVSSGEYILVANALANSNLVDEAVQMYKLAENKVVDYNDGVSLYQSEAQLLFLTGKPDEGRQYFQHARDIFTEFPTDSDFLKISINIQTELFWAQSEYSIGQCANLKTHTQNARALYTSLISKYPSSRQNMQSTLQQVVQTEAIASFCLTR